MRRESRGLHYSRDYPQMRAEAVDSVLVPGSAAEVPVPSAANA